MGFLQGRGLVQVMTVVIAVAFLCGAVAVKRGMRAGILSGPGEELMYFPSGRFLKHVSLGHESGLADIVWLRAIQYYGEHRMTDRKYEMIGHIFDVMTTLDPHFLHAYVFGALVLAQDAGKPEDALLLLRKGMRHNPKDWYLAFETGFIYYIVLRDYRNAGRYFTLSSKLPNAPPFTSRFAAFVEERAGHTETALKLWEEASRMTENARIKEMAEEKVQELKKELERERRAGIGVSKQAEPGAVVEAAMGDAEAGK
jgi:tetratricopeptide (TPR) repeat protein